MSKPVVSIVAALAKNQVIGRDGDMPWHVPSDLKRFKQLTLGKPMIMGRKTFESIGSALPGRTSIVVTRQADWQPTKPDPNVLVATSLDEAMSLAASSPGGEREICVVGGGEIYRQAMPAAEILHLTWVQAEPDGDTVFPQIDRNIWQTHNREEVVSGPRDSADLLFETLRRKTG